MGFLLTLLGILALVVALAGVGLGVYMATNPNTRDLGPLFALWWVPAVAAASGILMRDLVTFVIGLACFLVAGVVFVATGVLMRSRRVKSNYRWNEGPGSKDAGDKPRNRKTAS